jgi:hypothetical protein
MLFFSCDHSYERQLNDGTEERGLFIEALKPRYEHSLLQSYIQTDGNMDPVGQLSRDNFYKQCNNAGLS